MGEATTHQLPEYGSKGPWVEDLIDVLQPLVPIATSDIRKEAKKGSLTYKDASIMAREESLNTLQPGKQADRVTKGAFPAFGTPEPRDRKKRRSDDDNGNPKDGREAKKPRKSNNNGDNNTKGDDSVKDDERCRACRSKHPTSKCFYIHPHLKDHHRQIGRCSAVFSIIQVSFQAGQRYPLANSAILDSGATLHIFNNIHRFKRLMPATANGCVLAGEHPVKIEGYGSVDVMVRGPKRAMVLPLTGVAFCPTFTCNIISVRERNRRRIWWDNRLNRLVRNDGSTLCHLSVQEGQFVVESMPPSLSGVVFQARRKRFNTWTARAASVADATLWHHRLGRPGPRALEHLFNYTEGTRIKGITMVECDACALSKMKRQTSHRARNKPLQPGERLALDFHEFLINNQQQRYLLLITDRFSGFSWDYYLPSREASHILAALKHLFQLLNTQYDIVPKVMESDNEFSRAKIITSFCNNKGTKMEPSAAETPARNGGAERAGAVIKAKARAMRIGANLPEDLWIEITRAAVYLYNRTPRAGNNRQSPYERFHTAIARAKGNPDSPAKKPNNAHLKAYGCKAYGCKAFAMTRRSR